MRNIDTVIFESKEYRILECLDEDVDIENLKGDCFNPRANPDTDLDALAAEELLFEQRVADEGVFGYVLERWDGGIGKGWEQVDSCWGFLGRHAIGNRHYIVDEFERHISLNSSEVVE